MVSVKTYQRFFQEISRDLEISHTLIVSEESELQDLIREVADGDLILVAVIPVSVSEAPDADNIKEIDSSVAFALKKVEIAGLCADERLDVRDQTQQMITQVKTRMLSLTRSEECSEFRRMMKGLQLNSMQTEAEFNYLGCIGWSVSFQIKTDGFSFP